MKAAIITVNYYSVALINEIEAIVESIPQVELIVVDNSSDFCATTNRTKVVSPGANLGFGRACNLGALRSAAPTIFFLNPDTVITKDTLLGLIDFCERMGDDSVCGPLIRDGKGGIPTLVRPGRFGLMFRRVCITPDDVYELPLLYLSGACFGVSRRLFNCLGGFCETIFLYGEDLDFCLRASDLGAKVVAAPHLQVGHAGGRSSSKLSIRFKRLFLSFSGHYKFLRNQKNGFFSSAFNALHLASGLRL